MKAIRRCSACNQKLGKHYLIEVNGENMDYIHKECFEDLISDQLKKEVCREPKQPKK